MSKRFFRYKILYLHDFNLSKFGVAWASPSSCAFFGWGKDWRNSLPTDFRFDCLNCFDNMATLTTFSASYSLSALDTTADNFGVFIFTNRAANFLSEMLAAGLLTYWLHWLFVLSVQYSLVVLVKLPNKVASSSIRLTASFTSSL